MPYHLIFAIQSDSILRRMICIKIFNGLATFIVRSRISLREELHKLSNSTTPSYDLV
jgi:hypothetical protein